MQNRFRSILLWSAILAQVVSILLLTNVITPTESELINNIAAAAFQILTLVGILNNPKDSQNF